MRPITLIGLISLAVPVGIALQPRILTATSAASMSASPRTSNT